MAWEVIAMKKPLYKRWWVWLIAVIVVGGIVGGISDDENYDQEKSSEASEKSEDVEKDDDKDKTNDNEENNDDEEKPSLGEDIKKSVIEAIGDIDMDGDPIVKDIDTDGNTARVELRHKFSVPKSYDLKKDSVSIFEEVFKVDELEEVTLNWHASLVDKKGNTEDDVIMRVTIDEENNGSIDWENINVDDLPDISNDYDENINLD